MSLKSHSCRCSPGQVLLVLAAVTSSHLLLKLVAEGHPIHGAPDSRVSYNFAQENRVINPWSLSWSWGPLSLHWFWVYYLSYQVFCLHCPPIFSAKPSIEVFQLCAECRVVCVPSCLSLQSCLQATTLGSFKFPMHDDPGGVCLSMGLHTAES